MVKKYQDIWKRFIYKLFQIIAIIYTRINFSKYYYYDLVIVRVDAIGDYILWLDALSAYKEKYTGKSILLICADVVKPLADGDPFFTKAIGYNRSRFEHNICYFFSLLTQLKHISAKEVVYPVWERHVAGDIMVGMIGSKSKISFLGTGKHGFELKIFNKNYSRLIENPKTKSEIEAIEYFTQKVVSPQYRYGYHPIEVGKSESDVDGKYVVVAISASIEQKIWPLDRLASVIDTIPLEYKIVLTGAGKDDIRRANTLLYLIEKKERIIDKINATSLHQLINLIGNSCFVLGNDSAAIHIASAAHVPSICMFHGAHFGRFLPYPNSFPYPEYCPKPIYVQKDCFGCVYQCKYTSDGSLKCLMEVTEEMVTKEIDKLLISYFER